MAGEIRVELTPESLRKLLAIAKGAPPVIKRNLYRGIRAGAEPAAAAARETVLSANPEKAGNRKALARARLRSMSRLPQHTGLREGIAKGLKIGIRPGEHAGVRITSSAAYLKANQKRMNRTYNKETFRHPVFGHGSVPQHGVKWFYDPIIAQKTGVRAAVLAAMVTAAEELSKL